MSRRTWLKPASTRTDTLSTGKWSRTSSSCRCLLTLATCSISSRGDTSTMKNSDHISTDSSICTGRNSSNWWSTLRASTTWMRWWRRASARKCRTSKTKENSCYCASNATRTSRGASFIDLNWRVRLTLFNYLPITIYNNYLKYFWEPCWATWRKFKINSIPTKALKFSWRYHPPLS